MNILFINSIQMWGGAEVWQMDIMHGLENRGHQVTLVCRPGTILEKNAKNEGFDVKPVKMRSDFDPIVIWKIWRIIRKKNIQIICTNMDKELRFGGIAAKLSKNTIIIPSREVDYPLKNKLRYRFTYNFLADYVIANSNSTKKTLLRDTPWLNADRIEVVYKGIDPKPYLENPEEGLKLRSDLKISDNDFVVGFVGQIIERKGIPDIVESIPLVVEKFPNVKFLFVGEGKLEEFLISESKKLGVSENIICAGFRKDIPAVMKAMDLLILASSVEGFGLVLIEAMAAEKPVIATNMSSIPEIVQHEKTGFLIEVHNPKELAEAIIKIMKDKNLQIQLGKNGRERMLKNFTFERMLLHTESLFQKRLKANFIEMES